MILKGRFPRESCRSRRVLQLSLGNLCLRIKFCLDFWSIFVPGKAITRFMTHHRHHFLPISETCLAKTLNKISSSALGFHCKVVDLVVIYKMWVGMSCMEHFRWSDSVKSGESRWVPWSRGSGPWASPVDFGLASCSWWPSSLWS